MNVKLSIITPVFNGESFIESCILNVVQQQCDCCEHIILDACSTDGTADIIAKYAEKHAHIRWVSEKDKGQSDAMNKGIAMAKGEVVSFLNVDDYYEPNVLTHVVSLFENLEKPSLLVGNCNVWDDSSKLLFVNKPSKLKFVQLLVGPPAVAWPINPAAYFYHKSLHESVGLYKVEEHYALDLDFLLRAVQVAHIHYVNRVLGNYRFLEGTKTFIDQKDNDTAARNAAMMDCYKKKLPPMVRAAFPVYKAWQRVLHWGVYAKDPSLFFTVLSNKIMRYSRRFIQG